MHPNPRSSFTAVLITTLACIGASCAGDAPDDTPRQESVTLRASTAFDPLDGTCEHDEALLTLLLPEREDLACSGTTPEQVIDGCDSHPRAVCAPELGYRCSGLVRIGREVPDPCPAGFTEDPESEWNCIGQMPRRCNVDTDCPARTRCLHDEGGVCVSGCRTDEDCMLNETCDCLGLCRFEGQEGDAVSLRRALPYTPTTSLVFTRAESSEDAPSHAQRVEVSLSRLPNVVSQTVHVVATRGLMVYCGASALLGPAPDIEDYVQDCTIELASNGARRKALWVLPYNLDDPVVDSGIVYLRSGDGGAAATVPITVAIQTPPEPMESAPEGWYEGRLILAALNTVASDDDNATAQVALQLPLAQVTVPVRAWMGSEWELVLFDETKTLAREGRLLVQFSDTDTFPSVEDPPAWFGPGTSHAVDKAAGEAIELQGSLEGVAVAGGGSWTWNEEQGTLGGGIGLEVSGLGAWSAGLIWRFELSPTGGGQPPPSWNGTSAGPSEVERNAWIARAGDTVSFKRFDDITLWKSLTGEDSLVNCLDSPRYLPAELNGETVLLTRCDEMLGQDDPGFCSGAWDVFKNMETDLSRDFLKDRFEFCNTSCGCGGFNVEVPTSCTPPDVPPCTTTVKACLIDQETISPELYETGEDRDRYVLASTCATRLASFRGFSGYSDTDDAFPMLGAVHTSLYSSHVDGNTGDMYAVKGGTFDVETSAWFREVGYPGLEGVLPTSTPFFYNDGTPYSASEMAIACHGDLNRSVPSRPLPLNPLKEVGSWGLLRPHLEELFTSQGCIDIARFHIELDWLLAAAEIEADWEAFTPSEPEETVASKLLQHRLKQWLTIHAFVARNTSQQDKVEALLAVDQGQSSPGVSVGDALDTMERGWSLLLYPEYFDALAAMPGRFIAEPDYREAADTEEVTAYFAAGVPDHHEQGLGLPVVILETMAAHLELLDRYLDTIEVDLFAECSTSNATTQRDSKMQRYGDTTRYLLAVNALANRLYLNAAEAVADEQASMDYWQERWFDAKGKTAGTWLRVIAHVEEILSCTNPLGIDDETIPLYFVEPQTTNQKFFASSDYLLEAWAKPAVAKADNLLEAMRQASMAQRDADIRQTLHEHDHARRIEQLKIQYGTPLRDACGLEGEASAVFDQFRAEKLSLSDCYLVPSARHRPCASRLEQAWHMTDDEGLRQEIDACASQDADERVHEVIGAQRRMCVLVLQHALGQQKLDHLDQEYNIWWLSDVPSRFIELAGRASMYQVPRVAWEALKAYRLWNWTGAPYYGMMAILDGRHPDEPGRTWFDGIYEIGETLDGLLAGSSVSPTLSLPWLSSVQVSGCGGDLVFGEPGEESLALSADEITEMSWRYAAAIGLANDDHTCLVSSMPVTNTFRHCVEREYSGWHHPCIAYEETTHTFFPGSGLSCEEEMEQAKLGGTRIGKLCDDYLIGTMLGFGAGSAEAEALFDPGELAECYRGTLSEYELALLGARQQVRQAMTSLLEIQSRYDSTARSCVMLANLGEARREAMAEHNKAMMELSRTGGLFAAIGSAIRGDAVGVVTGAVQGVLDDQRQRVQHNFNMTMEKLAGQGEALQCWTQAAQAIAGYSLQIEGVKAALLNVSNAIVQHKNLVTRLTSMLVEGENIVDAEEARYNEIPDLRHHYWLDERKDRFERDFKWAKRLTYMAMLAAEYELQQTFGVRKLILDAAHPMELEEAVREIEREQATRGINGARPQAKTVVLSLRDDLLRLRQRMDDPAGERKLAPVNEFVAMLQDPASAVFSAGGEYLGQGIPFHLQPSEALHHRCAERMWSVSASLHGDLLGVIEPQLPVFLLKRNTAMSQWCDGHGPQGEEFQTAAIRPSVNLFRDGSQTGQAHETEAYAWSFLDAWINVRRHDFYSERYTEGASDELAGRGLYGDYMLLIPYHGFIEKGIPLDRVEDVMLKFDYISVSNGSGLGTVPPDFDVPPFDIGKVRNLQATPGVMSVTLTWQETSAPIGSGSYAVYRDEEFLGITTERTYVDEPPRVEEDYTYSVRVIDIYGDELEAAEVVGAAEPWPWGEHMLRADGVLDVLVEDGMLDIDTETSDFTVAVLVRDHALASGTGVSWSATPTAGPVALAGVQNVSEYSSIQVIEARRYNGNNVFSELEVSVSSLHGLSLQVAEVKRGAREFRVSLVTESMAVTSATTWSSTDSSGTFTPSRDLYLLSYGGSTLHWGALYQATVGLVGAIVFDGTLTSSQWQALAAGQSPWDVAPTQILRAYDPGAFYVDDDVTYMRDIGYLHGGPLSAKDARIRNGDSDDITPLAE